MLVCKFSTRFCVCIYLASLDGAMCILGDRVANTFSPRALHQALNRCTRECVRTAYHAPEFTINFPDGLYLCSEMIFDFLYRAAMIRHDFDFFVYNRVRNSLRNFFSDAESFYISYLFHDEGYQIFRCVVGDQRERNLTSYRRYFIQKTPIKSRFLFFIFLV